MIAIGATSLVDLSTVDLSFFSFFNTANNGDIPVPKKPIHYLSKQDFLKDFLLEVVVAKDMEWAPVFY
jgi:hypothetical protein